MIDIHQFMRTLSEYRPIFHSEADFQHAFAWQLHQQIPDVKVRLEYPVDIDGNNRMILDIWAQYGSQSLAIELKYKTSKAIPTIQHNDESFPLKDQSAQDAGRYDYIKDICRLEKIVAHNPQVQGLAIILTNDSLYWKNPKRLNTLDSAFRLNETRILSGTLDWRERTSTTLIKDRTEYLELRNEYSLKWLKYSEVGLQTQRQFRYLALEISRQD